MELPRTTDRRVALVAAAALAGVLASCGPAGPPADVVLVTIDTLRADRWGCLGDPSARTPESDRLARGGLLAFEGRAPAPLTLPSHVSMMTGLPPSVHGVRDNGIFALPADGPPTVAAILRDAGRATAAFISAFPLASRFGLERGFDHYDEHLRGGEDEEGLGHLRERIAADVVARVVRYFDRKRPPAEQPLFLWIHFFDPHAEYRAPAPWPAAVPGRPYDAEVAYVDSQLGALFRVLDDRRPGAMRRVVLASDHGEGLGEHGEDTHGVLLHAATIRVPLVVRDERYAPRLSGVPIALESVASTLLDLAGVDGGLADGAAASAAEFAGPVLAETLYPALNFGWSGLRAWEEGGWKLVTGAREHLYRTSTDPGEAEDLAASQPDTADRLAARLDAAWPDAGAAALLGAQAATGEETEALRSLGYLSAGGASAERLDDLFTTGPDPAERIGLLDDVNRGIGQLDAGLAAAAESTLAHVAAADPGNRLVWEYLGRARAAGSDPRGARDAFRRALELGPNPSTVYLDLARVERELGNDEAAWTVLESALRVDPSSVVARQAQARIRIDRGDPAGAIALLEEAAAIRPRSASVRASLAQAYSAAGRVPEASEQWRQVLELEPGGAFAAAANRALGAADPSGGKGGTP